jgi:hypothetical protein
MESERWTRKTSIGRWEKVVKILWFLKKADRLSMDEFRTWWLDGHAPVIAEKQGSMLLRYIVNIRTDADNLPAGTATPCEWDGMAEEWFEDEAVARKALSLPSAPDTRADVMAHVSSISRLIVTEHYILDRSGNLDGAKT